MDSSGGGEDLEAALAHELFHIIQNGIDHKEGLAWAESTALWMQHVVTGKLDWGYVQMGIENADRPLTDVADPWAMRYAQVVWPEFLAAHYGPEIVREIWLDANSSSGDEGMLHAYRVLGESLDGYANAIHLFRYNLWAEQGAPVTDTFFLSPSSSQVAQAYELKETAATYVKFEGDPGRTDGTLKLCVENLDARPGFLARVAYQEAEDVTPPGGSKTAPGSGVVPSAVRSGDGVQAKAAPAADTSWCEGARVLGNAPPGYRLPFSGYMIITDGPREGMHTGASSQAVDYAPVGGASWTVLAAADGEVLDATDDENKTDGFGKLLRIKHPDGRISFYAHLNSFLVTSGHVNAGEPVAEAGNTGNGAGYHLHFEVRSGWSENNVLSGSSVDIQGLPGTWWCDWYPPGDDRYSGWADPATAVASDDATFVTDTPPDDGTSLEPGDTFTKTWTIRNTGTSTWSADTYQAIRISGDFGPESMPLAGEIAPGDTVTLSGEFVVPDTDGEHKTTYKMSGPDGTFGEPFWVEIVVGAYDDAEFTGDESHPLDGAVVSPGETFVKSWTLLNTGTSTWDPYSYRLANKTLLFGPSLLRLDGEVAPQSLAEVAGSFTVPTTPGTYMEVFQMEGPNGLFGDGVWIDIVVADGGMDDAELVSESPPEAGAPCSADASVSKSWTLRNTGTSIWTTTFYRATRISGVLGPAVLDLPNDVNPEETVTLTADFVAPSTPGVYESTYQMEGYAGPFGDTFSVSIEVLGAVPGDGSSPVYEVAFDMSDPECSGGYLEVNGFGGRVPWVVVVASYAGDPTTGDLCRGHGSDPECGHDQTNPECGTARFKVTATMDYPEASQPICAYQADTRQRSPRNPLILVALLVLPALWIRRARVARG